MHTLNKWPGMHSHYVAITSRHDRLGRYNNKPAKKTKYKETYQPKYRKQYGKHTSWYNFNSGNVYCRKLDVVRTHHTVYKAALFMVQISSSTQYTTYEAV